MARRNKCALFCFGPPLRPQTPAAFVPAKTKQPHSVPVNLQKGCYTNDSGGEADEKEIREYQVLRACEEIKGKIRAAAQERQIAKFGISASAVEGEALARQYWTIHDPNAMIQQQRAQAVALDTAMTQVFGQGADPHDAWEKFLAPLGYPEAVWRGNLELGRTPEGRAKLTEAAKATVTVDNVIRDSIKSQTDFLKKQRLDEAVDLEIAREDARFRNYLEEEHRNTHKPNPFQRDGQVPADHLTYLIQKRGQWWQARYKEVDVVLNGPSRADRCGLGAALGVRVAGSEGK